MSIQLKVYGVMALGIGGMVAFSELDKSMNYVETDAYISRIDVDCFIKDSDSQVVEKSTNELAYMDCDIAPVIAPMHGHDESDIQYRYQLEYSYKAPVDRSRQKDTYTTTSHQEDKYKKNMNIKIFAHKEEPGKSRWN